MVAQEYGNRTIRPAESPETGHFGSLSGVALPGRVIDRAAATRLDHGWICSHPMASSVELQPPERVIDTMMALLAAVQPLPLHQSRTDGAIVRTHVGCAQLSAFIEPPVHVHFGTRDADGQLSPGTGSSWTAPHHKRTSKTHFGITISKIKFRGVS